MFRTAELQRKLPKEDYHQQVPRLREDHLMIQMELINAKFPVIVVFAGVDGAGKSETVNRLYERLGRVRTGVQRPGRAHQHRPCTVDAGRSER